MISLAWACNQCHQLSQASTASRRTNQHCVSPSGKLFRGEPTCRCQSGASLHHTPWPLWKAFLRCPGRSGSDQRSKAEIDGKIGGLCNTQAQSTSCIDCPACRPICDQRCCLPQYNHHLQGSEADDVTTILQRGCFRSGRRICPLGLSMQERLQVHWARCRTCSCLRTNELIPSAAMLAYLVVTGE